MPNRGDVRISEITGNRLRYTGSHWRPLCSVLTCNNLRAKKGYCKSHLETEEVIEKEKVINRKIPSQEIKDYYISLIKKPEKVVPTPENPKKGDLIIKKTGRLHVFNGNRWISCCVIENCKKQATISIFCITHYNELIKNDIVIKDDEQQCVGCNNIFTLEFFTRDNEIYKQCNNCRDVNRENSVHKHNKRRRIYIQLKIDLGGICLECGITDLEILEFDHIDPKTKLCRVYDAPSIAKMKEEAKKCELRCRRCHQMRSQNQHKDRRKTKDELSQTYGAKYQREYLDKLRKYVSDEKIKIGSCQECGWFDENYLSCLDFDHIDSTKKFKNICELIGQYTRIEILEKEIKKCRLLCKNCHQKHTNRQQDFVIVQLYEEMNKL